MKKIYSFLSFSFLVAAVSAQDIGVEKVEFLNSISPRTVIPNDSAMVGDSVGISVTLKNFGSQNIDNTSDTVKFRMSANGVLSPITLISEPSGRPGNLPPTGTAVLTVQEKFGLPGVAGNFELCVWTSYLCCGAGGIPLGDPNNYNDTSCASLTLYSTVGVHEKNKLSAISILSKENALRVFSANAIGVHFSLEVFDLTGRNVLTEKWNSEGAQTREIEFIRPSGYYVARLSANGEVVLNQKVFVK
jgi:hypothetical protein